MFCNICGNTLKPQDRFCPKCGNVIDGRDFPDTLGQAQRTEAMPVTTGGSQGPINPAKPNFFKTPGGIALTVFLAVLIIGGLSAGIYFLVRPSGNKSGEVISNAWTDYNDTMEEIDSKASTVANLGSASTTDITAFQQELKASNSKLGDISVSLREIAPDDYATTGYGNLKDAIMSTRSFINELDSFYTTFVADVSSAALDTYLDKLKELSGDITDSVDDFLNVNQEVTTRTFNSGFLETLEGYPEQLAAVRAGREEQAKEQEEQSRTMAVNQATSALNMILGQYVQGGWDAVAPNMTPALLKVYNAADPPWGQVSYIVTGAAITGTRVVSNTDIIFTVLEKHDEGGEIFTESGNWEMVKVNNVWLLNNVPFTYE